MENPHTSPVKPLSSLSGPTFFGLPYRPFLLHVCTMHSLKDAFPFNCNLHMKQLVFFDQHRKKEKKGFKCGLDSNQSILLPRAQPPNPFSFQYLVRSVVRDPTHRASCPERPLWLRREVGTVSSLPLLK